MYVKSKIILFLLYFSGIILSQECLGGELRTIESFLYGRFEVNIKSVEGDGYISSFFTYHDHWDDSNQDNEINVIDIVQIVSVVLNN